MKKNTYQKTIHLISIWKENKNHTLLPFNETRFANRRRKKRICKSTLHFKDFKFSMKKTEKGHKEIFVTFQGGNLQIYITFQGL